MGTVVTSVTMVTKVTKLIQLLFQGGDKTPEDHVGDGPKDGDARAEEPRDLELKSYSTPKTRPDPPTP